MKLLLSLAAMFALSATVFGFGEPTHSKIEITAAPNGDSTEFTFKILANKGYAVTFDAPWKLDLKKHEGLTFASSALSKNNMDEAIPGFKVKTTAQAGAAAGDIEYSLVSFICTTDKTICYREVHKGKYSWKK